MADPYRNFQYEVEIDGFTRAGFQKVSGLKRTTDITEYREGGDNATPRKLPGQTKYDNVTFERGMSSDNDFNAWYETVFTLDGVGGANPPANGFRKRIIVYLKDKGGNRVKKWVLKRCWPSEEAITDLDASSSDVLIEQLVVAHEGYTLTNLATGASPFED